MWSTRPRKPRHCLLEIAQIKKKEVRAHLHNLQMLNFRLFSAIFLLVLSLRVFFSFCRSSGTCSGLSCHTIIFIFSLKKEQHPHSVSCHKIFFISNSKETTFSPSLAFLSSSSPLLPTSQTRRESEHSWLSHFWNLHPHKDSREPGLSLILLLFSPPWYLRHCFVSLLFFD